MRHHIGQQLVRALLGVFGLVLAAGMGVALSGCDQPENGVEYEGRQEFSDAVKVTDVRLGSDITGRREVAEEKQTFHPNDDVFVQLSLEGTVNDVWMSARWFHQREQIHTSRHRINLAGEETTTLNFVTPDAMPTGRYTVEVSVNDQVMGAKQFEVVEPDDDGS